MFERVQSPIKFWNSERTYQVLKNFNLPTSKTREIQVLRNYFDHNPQVDKVLIQ